MCANDNPCVIPLLSVGKIYFVIKEIVKIAAVQPESCERNIIGRFANTQEARVAPGHALTDSYTFSCLATSYMHQYLDGCMLNIYHFLNSCISTSTDCNDPTFSDYFINFHGQSTLKCVHCSRIPWR